MIICKSQSDVDAALAADNDAEVEIVSGTVSVSISMGCPLFVVRADATVSVEARESSQPRVVARGSSQPRVVAWGSSQPRVEARESSQPRVEARESSQPRVVARGSSQPRVEAWGSSQPRVEARGYAQLSLLGRFIKATASISVSVILDGGASCDGGQQTTVARSTAAEWCNYYGVDVADGVATLFKAVDDKFKSPRGGDYTPGSTPVAPDWDGGERECGGGLHFSPRPAMAREFFSDATKFVACSVALSDISVHPDGDYPQKIKARGCCGPVWEVDEDGNRIDAMTREAVPA